MCYGKGALALETLGATPCIFFTNARKFSPTNQLFHHQIPICPWKMMYFMYKFPLQLISVYYVSITNNQLEPVL